jgi:uncharacterized protein (TIGR03000 family)
MYSVVLMAALSGGAEAPDFGRGCNGCAGACHGCSGGLFGGLFNKGCNGCNGCHGCSGCHVSNGCHGCNGCHCGGGGLFAGLFGKKRCNGCSSACHGCNGCHSSCNGCHGGCFRGLFNRCHGCNGCHSACHGCNGCHAACNGCTGGTTGGTTTTPEPKKKEMPKGKEEVSAPATIVVNIPAGAKLSVDGNATTSSAAVRTFVTPAIETGSDYVYTLRAEIEGAVETQTVTVRGGQTTNVTFAAASVASR